MDALTHAFGLPVTARQFPGPVEATVNRVTPTDLYVTVLGDVEVQVAWSGADPLNLPPTGTACLVLFADGDLDRGWAVAFSGWRP